MHVAALWGYVEILEWLYNIDNTMIYTYMDDGYTPLHCAAQGGHIKVGKWILQKTKRTMINIRDGDNDTPLLTAIKNNNIDVKLWLESEINNLTF